MNKISTLSWDDLRLIAAIGDGGSLAAAAMALGVTHSTTSRRLAVVEETLGVVLFDRHRTGYVPTPAGLEVIELGLRMERDVLSLTRRLTGGTQAHSGELHIATSDVLFQDFLGPIIVAFQRKNPAIRIEVAVSNEHFNLAKSEADIAFRATKSPPENLYGRKVASIAWAIYGARSLYMGRNLGIEDLYKERWVSYDGNLRALQAYSAVEQHVPRENVVFRVDSVAGARSALCAGAGIGYLPCTHGGSSPALVRLSAIETEGHDDLWVLTHPDIRKSDRVRAFMAHCIEEIIKLKPLIQGTRDFTGL